MQQLRVTVLTQWYPPEPAWQPLWIVSALQEAGATCRVVTGVPNYPTGAVHAGYRAWRRSSETIDGTDVLRTPLYPHHGQSALRRMANYGSWAASSTVLAQRWLSSADVVLVYASPATAAAAAMLARRLSGTPYVLLVEDLWPDSVTQSGMVSPRRREVMERVLTPLVGATYRRAAKVVAVTQGMRRLLAERGVDEDRLELVYNWVPEPDDAPEPAPTPLRELLGIPPEDFVLMYAGNHGVAQGLGPVVEAFAEATDGRHLVLVGDGIEKDALQRRARALDAVHLVDPQPSSVVRSWMQESDAQLVSLTDEPLFSITIPSKLQMALAEGRPVLAAVAGEVAELVEECRAGVSARPGDPGSIRDGVTTMMSASPEERSAWAANARAHYEATMLPATSAARLVGILREAAGRACADPSRRTP